MTTNLPLRARFADALVSGWPRTLQPFRVDDAERLLAFARTGLGLPERRPAPEVIAGFERLVASLRDEAQLHPLGELLTGFNLMSLMRARLRLDDDWATRPEIAREQITAPVVITGLPRTGSTLLPRTARVRRSPAGAAGLGSRGAVTAARTGIERRQPVARCV